MNGQAVVGDQVHAERESGGLNVQVDHLRGAGLLAAERQGAIPTDRNDGHTNRSARYALRALEAGLPCGSGRSKIGVGVGAWSERELNDQASDIPFKGKR